MEANNSQVCSSLLGGGAVRSAMAGSKQYHLYVRKAPGLRVHIDSFDTLKEAQDVKRYIIMKDIEAGALVLADYVIKTGSH